MELSPLETYYARHTEPNKSCLSALRGFILRQYPHLEEAFKYGMPFFCYKKKMFCYLWTDKKTHQPYLGVVMGGRIKHPKLIQGTRARMKILYIDPQQDLPVTTITEILDQALTFYP